MNANFKVKIRGFAKNWFRVHVYSLVLVHTLIKGFVWKKSQWRKYLAGIFQMNSQVVFSYTWCSSKLLLLVLFFQKDAYAWTNEDIFYLLQVFEKFRTYLLFYIFRK